MILNNKVSQRLEIIGFKGAVKKSTSRIQGYALFPDHFRLAMILYTIAQIQIDQCLVLDANVSECRISSTNPGSLGKSGDDPQSF